MHSTFPWQSLHLQSRTLCWMPQSRGELQERSNQTNAVLVLSSWVKKWNCEEKGQRERVRESESESEWEWEWVCWLQRIVSNGVALPVNIFMLRVLMQGHGCHGRFKSMSISIETSQLVPMFHWVPLCSTRQFSLQSLTVPHSDAFGISFYTERPSSPSLASIHSSSQLSSCHPQSFSQLGNLALQYKSVSRSASPSHRALVTRDVGTWSISVYKNRSLTGGRKRNVQPLDNTHGLINKFLRP